MLPLFSAKFKIHSTHQRGIKNLSLKKDNKQNSWQFCKKKLRILQSNLVLL